MKVAETFFTGLKKLKGFGAQMADSGRAELLKNAPSEELVNSEKLEELILKLGLNNEGLEEFPEKLRPFCGEGLLIWQYPIQFAPYLIALSKLKIRSYLEIGVRHGGTFIATTEYLSRFGSLDFSVAVDLLPCPVMKEYEDKNPQARFHRLNSQSKEFQEMLGQYKSFDLVLIDAFHEENHCRREFQAVKKRAKAVALHDIASDDYPGIARLWQEIKAAGEHECYEFTRQYHEVGRSYMGLGLAIYKGPTNEE